jgi:hypothetical protein
MVRKAVGEQEYVDLAGQIYASAKPTYSASEMKKKNNRRSYGTPRGKPSYGASKNKPKSNGVRTTVSFPVKVDIPGALQGHGFDYLQVGNVWTDPRQGLIIQTVPGSAMQEMRHQIKNQIQ